MRRRNAELEAALKSHARQIVDLKRALADVARKAHAFEVGLSSDCDCPERYALRQAVHVLIGD